VPKRARAYGLSREPVGTPLAPPEGTLDLCIPSLGLSCLSSSEPMYTETIFIRARSHILSFLQEVALEPYYVHPFIMLDDCPRPPMTEQNWEELPEEEKPTVSKKDAAELKEEMKQVRRWKKFDETGKAPDTDSETEPEP
jgi:hypothetical protein